MEENTKRTTFLNLPKEKQNVILNAAMRTFGENGYKKTSVSDIASAAGISKSMVFHYFGSKKELYLYLSDMCAQLILSAITEKFDADVTDFFARIEQVSDIKIAVMKQYPAALSFLTSAYFETEAEVREEVAAILNQGGAVRNQIAFDGVDTAKFKDGIDVGLVMNMLVWMAEGFAKHITLDGKSDLDTLFNQYWDCMNLLKHNFYREEFL